MAVVAVAAVIVGRSPYSSAVNYTPEQPVPFSHQHHVGALGIDCRYCHTSVEQSSFAGIPSTHTCMTCHSQIFTDQKMLAPVRQSLMRDAPIHWVRVHDLADFVYFNHRIHVQNGVGCESCHGRVDKMPLMQQAKPLSMQWCLGCHRNPAPNLRPLGKITAMGYQPAQDGIPGEVLMQRYGIDHPNRLSECYTCHR
ncbi:MAG: cytochrome c family protein [Nitrococcus sp.]|nr:cytochrome c family protein [Nitrococcus sp.]